MKRAKRMEPRAKWRWMPVGYYANRPTLVRRYVGNGMARMESFRFITSPPL